MIGFLQPLWLLALSAAAIPALLHLRQRQTPPTVVFPAVRYLQQTKREHSQRLKLRNLLLLILRTLIIMMIVLAAARPVATVSIGGVHAPTSLAIVVDNSLSSGVVLGGRRLSDLLVERARDVVGRVAETDHLWLVLADGVPRRLSRLDAARVLDSVAPQPLRLDLGDAVRAASAAVEGDILPAQEVVVFSDLQATALSQRGGRAPLARVLFWEAPPSVENRGIDSARAEPGVWRPSGSVIAAIGGSGTGSSALQLRVGDQELARSVAAPGERVALRPRVLQHGWYRATVELDPDELRSDDAWNMALRVAPPASARANLGAGRFVREGLSVLQGSGRIGSGDVVVLDDRLMSGRGVMFPPADPVLVGAANRALAARGFPWRFGEVQRGEWQLEGTIGAAAGQAVLRRHHLDGAAVGATNGQILATAGGQPWMVRDRDLILIASRLEQEWTALPVSAAFVPFLDLLVNALATSGSVVVSAQPGSPLELPPNARTVHSPDGPTQGTSEGRYAAPLRPGIYFLSSASGDTVGALEVNHDARESQLAPANRRALRATLGPDVEVLDEEALARDMFRGNRRADLSGMLIAAAVLAALAELFLATAGGRMESQ